MQQLELFGKVLNVKIINLTRDSKKYWTIQQHEDLPHLCKKFCKDVLVPDETQIGKIEIVDVDLPDFLKNEINTYDIVNWIHNNFLELAMQSDSDDSKFTIFLIGSGDPLVDIYLAKYLSCYWSCMTIHVMFNKDGWIWRQVHA